MTSHVELSSRLFIGLCVACTIAVGCGGSGDGDGTNTYGEVDAEGSLTVTPESVEAEVGDSFIINADVRMDNFDGATTTPLSGTLSFQHGTNVLSTPTADDLSSPPDVLNSTPVGIDGTDLTIDYKHHNYGETYQFTLLYTCLEEGTDEITVTAAVAAEAEVAFSVDTARAGLNTGKANFALNGLAEGGRGKFIQEDARKWLQRQERRRDRKPGEFRPLDLVVCDPPVFASARDGGKFSLETEWPLLAGRKQSVQQRRDGHAYARDDRSTDEKRHGHQIGGVGPIEFFGKALKPSVSLGLPYIFCFFLLGGVGILLCQFQVRHIL